MGDQDEEWQRKGATLSDQTAREVGLTQEEISEAIRAGKLRYRLNSAHGNPWLRLLRREVRVWSRPGTATGTSGNGRPGPRLPPHLTIGDSACRRVLAAHSGPDFADVQACPR
jgi:hypothetical protein